MLQQTQSARVAPKFVSFVRSFPNFKQLAKAQQHEVLKHWQGLGYNRRAISLHRTSKLVHEQYRGRLPAVKNELKDLPGIGEYTSGAILVFAYKRPEVLIETNIRAVFITHFFPKERIVSDAALTPLIAAALDHSDPARWYDALMDYGAFLKRRDPTLLKKSAHFRPQSRFEGSHRQKRGMLLKFLDSKPFIEHDQARELLELSSLKTKELLAELQKEGFLKKEGGSRFRLA